METRRVPVAGCFIGAETEETCQQVYARIGARPLRKERRPSNPECSSNTCLPRLMPVRTP
jgi:hypothetical protein